MAQPVLYYDLGSPYAYLAVERAADVLGVEPRLQPVLVGGIFVLRGHGSWSQTPERETRIAEVDARAERYGLAPLSWPPDWPNNTLKAMRAVVWAEGLGAGERFATAAFRQAFAAGRDLSDVDVLVEIAESVGLPSSEVGTAIEEPAVKEGLKDATSRAWERGVIGVPCIGIGEEILYGDDQLEAAASRLDGPGFAAPSRG
jgi:2-hydroxychromene-2-carboxylate isomerase